MNHLESLVPARETCARMKAAGFPQDTALVWTEVFGLPAVGTRAEANELGAHILCAAPTLQEILGHLPDPISINDTEMWVTVSSTSPDILPRQWEVCYESADEAPEYWPHPAASRDANAAEAAALLYLTLVLEGHIAPTSAAQTEGEG